MPNTCHPSLEHAAKAVLSARESYQIQLPILGRLSFATYGDDEMPISAALPILTLIKRKCAGGAPYVGRPFAYYWWAWVADDGTNRAITTDSELVYTMSDGDWLTRERQDS
jgi:hypothetical protein